MYGLTYSLYHSRGYYSNLFTDCTLHIHYTYTVLDVQLAKLALSLNVMRYPHHTAWTIEQVIFNEIKVTVKVEVKITHA